MSLATPMHPVDELAALSRTLDAAPLDLDLHRQMLAALTAGGDQAGQAAHELALAAFEMLGPGASPMQQSLVLYNLATVYSIRGRRAAAKQWYAHALTINPQLAIAHQNLSALLEDEGRLDQAMQHRNRAYQLQRIYVERAVREEQRRLLILGAGRGAGNVPIEGLLRLETISRIKYAIDYADISEDAELPPYDLVLNGIGDADVAQPLAQRIAGFTQACDRPVLNPPEIVARTHRHLTGTLLDGIEHVDVPPCIRLDAAPASPESLTHALDHAGIDFPLLMRPPATHGGEGIELHAGVDTLWQSLQRHQGPAYLTEYRDFRNADGYFRKYRMIFIDRVPYPYHLAISPDWIVHYYTAQMLEHPWKLDEERRFLGNPRAALGESAMNALIEIGQRLDLDYGGIDFSLMPDGRVLVFEANATMLAHREAPAGPLAHKNLYVQRIADAFEQMQCARLPR